MQSRVWAEFQQSLGRDPVHGMGDGWMWTAALRQSRGLRYLLSSYGPSAHDRESFRRALDDLILKGRELKADFIRAEPKGLIAATDLKKLDGRQIGEVQPAHTQIIDLTKDEDQLRSDLNSGHRNPINTASKKGGHSVGHG